ncbi:MAG: hypothetical protein AB1798_22240, partial [Spirochaetota bacterium]
MDFMEKMQKTINQGLSASKELFGKAKEKAKDLGEQGVLKFEIMQLENQAEKLIAKLGSRVYEVLAIESQNTITKKTSGIKDLL